LIHHQQQQQQHHIDSKISSTNSTSLSSERSVYLGHTSLLPSSGGCVENTNLAVKTEPRSCDGRVIGQPYPTYYQHPHQLGVPTNEHQQVNYYTTQEISYHHQHHVSAAAKLLASS
jgi:GATA-binding protein 4